MMFESNDFVKHLTHLYNWVNNSADDIFDIVAISWNILAYFVVPYDLVGDPPVDKSISQENHQCANWEK